MEIKKLESHLRELIALEETESPVVSLYIDRRDTRGMQEIQEQINLARKALSPETQDVFDRAIERIYGYVRSDTGERPRSHAVFAREGSEPFFLALDFEATLPNRVFVETTPVIFHLVELKDNFHRFVLMISKADSAQILEVSLGAVTREMWTSRPELRKRVGREWTKRHYQNHRRDRTNRFVKEKIELLDEITRSGGHSHLVLAGHSQSVARVRNALPRRLADMLVDVVPASSRDKTTDVVEATLSSFLAQEELESLGLVNTLKQEILRNGLAVAGYEPTRRALEMGQADVLILNSGDEGPATLEREELLRLAHKTGVHVEVVDASDFLADVEGVGCLLRYRMPGVQAKTADESARSA